jgi:hypothetical protein
MSRGRHSAQDGKLMALYLCLCEQIEVTVLAKTKVPVCRLPRSMHFCI